MMFFVKCIPKVFRIWEICSPELMYKEQFRFSIGSEHSSDQFDSTGSQFFYELQPYLRYALGQLLE
jgi:hypothetical protein